MSHTTRKQTVDSIEERLQRKGLLRSPRSGGTRPVVAVTADSRKAKPNTVFVALEGTVADGHEFIEDAVRSGVNLVVSERSLESPAAIRVTNARRALAEIACALEGDPARDVRVTAVTGTNGKTTTAWLIAQALSAVGLECGFLGTTGYGRPGHLQAATHTTPDPVGLQRNLAALRDEGCGACALEASSHAIDQERLWGVDLAAAVFTNLTRDHLDYHRDMEDYREVKARLFRDLDSGALAVANADDPNGRAIVAETKARVLTFGMGPDADVGFAIRSNLGSGLRMRLDGQDARFRLAGSFNAYNLAAAYAALEAYGVHTTERIGALTEASGAPGRFEIIPLPGERIAVVDYAHTPDALRNVLEGARAVLPAGARLWCVFGCGGDRDPGKRPIMGAMAERYADRVVVTSDNPRSEDPSAILDDVRPGVRVPEQMEWIVDRSEAIHRAIQSAGVGDVVVVAGKGHEPYQVIGTTSRPFSDLAEIKKAAGV
jgi:UDP-N-acetylmuramoyl-L-alanyl-D-glutamate--2,6-diaminopimelate ligase